MENVERGETYIETGRTHLRDDTTRFSMVGIREPITPTDHPKNLGVLIGEGSGGITCKSRGRKPGLYRKRKSEKGKRELRTSGI